MYDEHICSERLGCSWFTRLLCNSIYLLWSSRIIVRDKSSTCLYLDALFEFIISSLNFKDSTRFLYFADIFLASESSDSLFISSHLFLYRDHCSVGEQPSPTTPNKAPFRWISNEIYRVEGLERIERVLINAHGSASDPLIGVSALVAPPISLINRLQSCKWIVVMILCWVSLDSSWALLQRGH